MRWWTPSGTREPIPSLHDAGFPEMTAYHQVCVIPFERGHLVEFVGMDETTLEQVESVDVFRLLETGHDVCLEETEYETAPVDTPEDHERSDRDFQTTRATP